MLGALLGALQTKNPPDFPEYRTIEDESDDSHWASDKNRFEDWFLNGDAAADLSDGNVYY